jgi:hypothetical protein
MVFIDESGASLATGDGTPVATGTQGAPMAPVNGVVLQFQPLVTSSTVAGPPMTPKGAGEPPTAGNNENIRPDDFKRDAAYDATLGSPGSGSNSRRNSKNLKQRRKSNSKQQPLFV